LPKKCLTDYISIEKLQLILDETSQQDGIALRIWFPENVRKNKTGWRQEWVNACNYHDLIRSYPIGKTTYHEYFAGLAERIEKKGTSIGHIERCPTSLYVFGFPIKGEGGEVLAVLFGGLIRGLDKKINPCPEWDGFISKLEEEQASLLELENEYEYVTELAERARTILFNKWSLFCELLRQATVKWH